MKRFYKLAAVAPVHDGWTVTLDKRPIRTPARAPFVVPSAALGRAIADEWNMQADDVRPADMPLTGLANAAIDRVAPARQAFIEGLVAYGDGDVLLYRAEHPADLVRRQVEVWNPILAWAEARYGVEFELARGIIHQPQPAATLARLRAALDERDDFTLAAMQPLVTILGSLVAALALAERAIDEDTAWTAGQLDELYQAEKWGEDALAARSRAARRAALAAAARMLSLLTPGS